MKQECDINKILFSLCKPKSRLKFRFMAPVPVVMENTFLWRISPEDEWADNVKINDGDEVQFVEDWAANSVESFVLSMLKRNVKLGNS